MKRTLQLTIGFALVLLCGCAVLTVDVDVYTGPLSNTVEVQAEQVIALVMGAKPLLVQLRDYLEVKSYRRHELKTEKGAEELIRWESSLQADLNRFRTNEWYWAGFFAAKPSGGATLNLHNDGAIRVNDILALYEDRTPWDLSPLMDRGRTVIQAYDDAYKVFHGDTNKAVEFWNECAQKFAGVQTNYTNSANLSFAYWRLLVPTSNNYYGPIQWREETNLVAHFVTKYAPQYRYANPTNANSVFDFLCNTNVNVLRKDASTLFGTNANRRRIRARFEVKVAELANAFTNTRTATHELLVLALDAHMLAFRTNVFGERFLSPLQRQTVQSGSAEVIAATLEPWLLAKTITEGTNYNNVALSNLATRFKPPIFTNVGKDGSFWSEVEYKNAKEVIKKGLADDGASLSAALLALDDQLQRSSATNEAYLFGLAQGPNCGAKGLLPSTEIGHALAELRGLTDSAFAGGRQQQGMETLIEDYLTGASPWFEDRSQSPQFSHLLDALVAFGQKIATLGNTAGLIDSHDDAEVWKYKTVLQYVGNAILVHVDELKNRALHENHLKKQAKFTAQLLRDSGFTNALFASTNAQFFETNGLDAKDLLEHLLDYLRAQQVKAILDQPGILTNASLFFSSPTNAATNRLVVLNIATVTNLSLGTTNPTSSTTLVTNVIIEASGSNLANITLTLTNRAALAPVSDKFLKAIERVTEMKNDRIYLRPASAYLRSSYPASALRPNTSVVWENQLEKQVWRSIPLVGSALSGDGSIFSASRSRQKLFSELDKQSWQNINRVRVSGAGKVNYAITKDDVGNWYVKNYSADPSNIFNSARNLAMYSAGGDFRTALSGLAVNPQAGLSTNAGFAAQFDKAQTNYLALTTNTWTNLTNQLLRATFTNQIRAAWTLAGLTNSIVDQLSGEAFSADLQALRSNVVFTSTNKTDAAITNVAVRVDAQILDVLHAVKRYHAAVLPKLQLTNQTNDLKVPRQEFTRAVREFLDSMIAERERALDRFEAGLDIIHGATGP